jgi:hypothetical protein
VHERQKIAAGILAQILDLKVDQQCLWAVSANFLLIKVVKKQTVGQPLIDWITHQVPSVLKTSGWLSLAKSCSTRISYYTSPSDSKILQEVEKIQIVCGKNSAVNGQHQAGNTVVSF